MIGLFSGGLATLFLKLLEHFLGKAKEKAEQDSGIRNELRVELDRKQDENKQLKIDLDVAENQADTWRAKYWQIYERLARLRMQMRMLAEHRPDISQALDEDSESDDSL